MRPPPGGAVSAVKAYAVFRPLPRVWVSKATVYVVLQEGEPPAPDVEAKVSKSTAYIIMQPGPNGPLSYITASASDILYGGMPSARVSSLAVEALIQRTSAALVSGSVAEVLTRRLPAAFVSGAVLEVLRSTAEVTVSALVSTVALDVMAVPPEVNCRVSSVIVEVLMPASDDTDLGSVWVVG